MPGGVFEVPDACQQLPPLQCGKFRAVTPKQEQLQSFHLGGDRMGRDPMTILVEGWGGFRVGCGWVVGGIGLDLGSIYEKGAAPAF